MERCNWLPVLMIACVLAFAGCMSEPATDEALSPVPVLQSEAPATPRVESTRSGNGPGSPAPEDTPLSVASMEPKHKTPDLTADPDPGAEEPRKTPPAVEPTRQPAATEGRGTPAPETKPSTTLASTAPAEPTMQPTTPAPTVTPTQTDILKQY